MRTIIFILLGLAGFACQSSNEDQDSNVSGFDINVYNQCVKEGKTYKNVKGTYVCEESKSQKNARLEKECKDAGKTWRPDNKTSVETWCVDPHQAKRDDISDLELCSTLGGEMVVIGQGSRISSYCAAFPRDRESCENLKNTLGNVTHYGDYVWNTAHNVCLFPEAMEEAAISCLVSGGSWLNGVCHDNTI